MTGARTAIVGVLSAALAIVAVASCLVSRKSSDLACSDDGDCEADRMCDRGYCVTLMCPSECSSCDLVNKSCTINCQNANSCDDVSCPAGYDCTINCSKTNACDDIDCTQGKSCTVNCSASGACKDVTCGTGLCKVNCSASGSCDVVDCHMSCKCDVTCASGACDDKSCPMGTTAPCTTDGLPTSTCSSTTQAGCSTCP
jgi:hypothetical protein